MHRRTLLRLGVVAAGAAVVGCLPRRNRRVEEDASSTNPQHGALGHADGRSDRRVTNRDTTDREVARQPSHDQDQRDKEIARLEEVEPGARDTVDGTGDPRKPRIEVICRQALGLAAAGAGTKHTIDRLTLHHTAVKLEQAKFAPERLRGHQRYHQQHGWADIAYHFGVDLAGNVYELRDPDLAGETFTDYDPAGHFLVVCEGDFDQQAPTDTMLTAVAELFAHGADRYDTALSTLTGHRDHASTTCPGDALYEALATIEGEARARLNRGAPTLDSVCDDRGLRRVADIESGS